jgi:hypothetical protein
MKPFADLMISTEYLDGRIASNNLFPLIRGYEGRNRSFATAFHNQGYISQAAANSMILDEEKAKRILTVITLLRKLYVPKQDPDYELRTGDIAYIWGHPEYVARYPNGSFRGENVFFAGYNEAGLKMFMGYGKNFDTGPKQLKEVQASLALEYLGLPEFPEGYRDEIDSIIYKRTPLPTSDFATAFAVIRTRRLEGIQILNLDFIQMIQSQLMAGGSIRKRRYRSRHRKRYGRSTIKRHRRCKN